MVEVTAMSKKNDKIKNRYNRVSTIYDWLEKPVESLWMGKWREQLIKKVEGKEILEVGVGTGKNLPYYPDNLEITGVDFSQGMIEKAQKRVEEQENIKLIEMDAQEMKFEANSFDTILTSFVFCSVPDPVKGLKEIRRVCKKNGKVVMLEHVRSDHKILGKLMDFMNFIPLTIWGANINRNTVDNLIKAGFKEKEIHVEKLVGDLVKKIEIRNVKE